MKKLNTLALFSVLFYGMTIHSLSHCHAASIAITNADFETGGISTDNGSTHSDPGPGPHGDAVIPTGWVNSGGTTGGFYGYWNPDATRYPGADGDAGVATGMLGPNVFYFGSLEAGQGIEQTLSSNFAIDTNYALTVASGSRLGAGADNSPLQMNLYAGTTVIATSTTTINHGLGEFTDIVLNYTSDAGNNGLAGQALKIEFLEQGGVGTGVVEIDNVRLTATPVPEVSTIVWNFGTLGLLAFTLHRKKIQAKQKLPIA